MLHKKHIGLPLIFAANLPSTSGYDQLVLVSFQGFCLKNLDSNGADFSTLR